MPSLLASPFPSLVAAIPVANHAIEVKASFWYKPLCAAGHQNIHSAIFEGNEKIQLSRWAILNSKPSPQKCVEVLFWGYPGGMRGNQHEKYLNNLQLITKASSGFQNGWKTYYRQLHSLGSLGISTISKLAYFHQASFSSHPALILDDRIIKVLNQNIWVEFQGLGKITRARAPRMYPNYLQTMANVAGKMGVKSDQLEFFLFSLGNAFA